jgi:cytochrome subunit of sulfide dehydrogenase
LDGSDLDNNCKLAPEDTLNMVHMLLVALLTALLLPAASYAAADAKLTASCAECHGDKGVSTAQDVPTIAGTSATVQSDWLKAYRGKTVPCPKVNYKRGDTNRKGDMCSVAKDLSDAEIADLADYHAKLAYVAQKQAFDAGKAAAGKALHDRDCKKCHSAGGKDPSDDAGILAGQPLEWLKVTLAAFQKGTKDQPKKMKDVSSKLTDPELDALANFYASEQ